MIRNTLIVILACLCGFVLTGCDEPYQTPQITTKPAYSITVNQLASQLGLTVEKAGNPHYELTDANNRVLLFVYGGGNGGNVYVNGKAVCPVGRVVSADGADYVSNMLVPKIREHLVTSYAPPVTLPTPYETPKPGFVSGTVVVDPGHGGSDPGAQSVLGYWEKDVNIKIAHKLANYLRDAGVNVVMTREGDTYPTLDNRVDLANRTGTDLFVSIHCNTNGDSIHRGFTVYIAQNASWASKKAGRNIENTLSSANIPSKGLRKDTRGLRVLVKTICPAVLVECGFMSNYAEAALLLDPWYQDKLARAIADGVTQSL